MDFSRLKIALILVVATASSVSMAAKPSFRDCANYVAHWVHHYSRAIPADRSIDEAKRLDLAEAKAQARLASKHRQALWKESTAIEKVIDLHRRLMRGGMRHVDPSLPTHVPLAAARESANNWLRNFLRQRFLIPLAEGKYSALSHYFYGVSYPTAYLLEVADHVLVIELIIARYLEEFNYARFELSLPPRLWRPNDLYTVEVAHRWASFLPRDFENNGVHSAVDYLENASGLNAYIESEAKSYDTLSKRESRSVLAELKLKLNKETAAPFRSFLNLYIETVERHDLNVIYPVRDLLHVLDEWDLVFKAQSASR